MAVTTGVAAVLFTAWRVWQTDEPVAVFLRGMRDVEVDWRCDGGHRFRSTGEIDPRPCWKCGLPAHPVTQYVCPRHGAFEVAFRFRVDADGVTKPLAMRVAGGEWVNADEELKCPRCGRTLDRKELDPLDQDPKPRPN